MTRQSLKPRSKRSIEKPLTLSPLFLASSVSPLLAVAESNIEISSTRITLSRCQSLDKRFSILSRDAMNQPLVSSFFLSSAFSSLVSSSSSVFTAYRIAWNRTTTQAQQIRCGSYGRAEIYAYLHGTVMQIEAEFDAFMERSAWLQSRVNIWIFLKYEMQSLELNKSEKSFLTAILFILASYHTATYPYPHAPETANSCFSCRSRR